MNTKFFKRIFFASLLLIPLQTFSAASDTPRMWLVKGVSLAGAPKKFYILAITHLGLDSEYDAYLDKVILPAFKASNMLLYENAPVSPFSARPCENTWAETKEGLDLLQMAKDRARVLMQESMQPPLKDMDASHVKEVEKTIDMQLGLLSEYGLLTLLKSIDTIEPGHAIQASLGRGQVTDYLIQKSGSVQTKSIDTGDELVTAYCSMTKHRVEVFRRSMQNSRFDTPVLARKFHADREKGVGEIVQPRVNAGA